MYQSDYDGQWYEDERDDPNSGSYQPDWRAAPDTSAAPAATPPAAGGGHIDGVGDTIAPGSSITPAQRDQYFAEARAAGVPEDFIQSFANDPHRILSAWQSQRGGGSADDGATATAGGSWFAQNAPPSGGGFTEQYTALARPSYLQGEYKPPTWDKSFTPLSREQVMQDPGYQTGLQTGVLARDRSAAAQGSLLNGGTQKALTRFGIDYGNNFYDAANTRAFDAYKQQYGQFQDAAAAGAQARGINENAFQGDANNALTQYQQRYRTYQDAIQNNLDYARLGLGATTAGSPA